ncbi:MAG: hypothetical protein ACRC78_12605 [Planktothrix sp.]
MPCREDLIEKLMKRHNVPILYPGEPGYITLSARLIAKELNQWLKDQGSIPDVKFQTVRSWFYKSFPSWAVAVLNQK